MTAIAIKEVLSFLLKYWYIFVIVILGIFVQHYHSKYEREVSTNKELIALHEKELLNLQVKHKEELLKQQGMLIETNEKITEVIGGLHEQLEKQTERTKEIYKEVQTFIPSSVRESCDFSVDWLRETNNYIRSSNNTHSNNP